LNNLIADAMSTVVMGSWRWTF